MSKHHLRERERDRQRERERNRERETHTHRGRERHTYRGRKTDRDREAEAEKLGQNENVLPIHAYRYGSTMFVPENHQNQLGVPEVQIASQKFWILSFMKQQQTNTALPILPESS